MRRSRDRLWGSDLSLSPILGTSSKEFQMQGDTAVREANSPAVGLFQKAHGKMVMLQRLDAQLAS